MRKSKLFVNAIAVAVLTLGAASLAQAQATRTWVSAEGDDANPCSRTAPCKTWSGAVARTFINGEIDALDPGGFGAVTLIKSITLDGTQGNGFGSVLAGANTGVTINLTDNSGNDPLKTVRLRNLSINGTGGVGTVGNRVGINGVRIILATGSVFVENCLITDFTKRGISDERATGGKLFVKDTIVRNTTETGIAIVPATGSTRINAVLDNVTVENCNFGVAVGSGARVMVNRSVFSGNALAGIYGEGFAASSEINVNNCVSSHNASGVQNGGGATGTVIRLSNTDISFNSTGIVGTTSSFGNNRISGNGAAGAAPTALGADSHDKAQQ